MKVSILILTIFVIIYPKAYADNSPNLCQNGELGGIVGDLFIDDRKKIASNVFAIFSPSMFEAYSYTLDKLSNVIYNPKFNPQLRTVIYIHGWREDGEDEKSVMAIRGAYRDRDDHNIIIIDWSHYSRLHFPLLYVTPIANLKIVAEIIAEELEQIRKSKKCNCHENFYLVGHSLGGQGVGHVGRHLKKISNGEFVISRIYGLDPAGPGFEFQTWLGSEGFHSINSTDGQYVQIIHTNGGTLGIRNARGHADFYPNGGEEQTGCPNFKCNHYRSWLYFQETLREEQSLIGVKCKSYKEFEKNKCNYAEIGVIGLANGTLPMGVFYLRTHPNEFGSGMSYDGLNNRQLTMISEDGDVEEVSPFNYNVPVANNTYNVNKGAI